jgi:hypothetical protein
VFRTVEKYQPTLLADECDGWLRPDSEVLPILNSGYFCDGTVIRCAGDDQEPRAFKTFAPVVLCGIRSLPDTLQDRSIVIRLERARPGERKARFLPRHAMKETEELRRGLARFCADSREDVEKLYLQMVNRRLEHDYRLDDNWMPLFAIAQVAGGDWPQRVDGAFQKASRKTEIEVEGPGILLLTDIRELFHDAARRGLGYIPTADVTKALGEMKEREWSEWGRKQGPISQCQLAKLLRPFGIESRNVRVFDKVPKCYCWQDFEKAFQQYLPAMPQPTLL